MPTLFRRKGVSRRDRVTRIIKGFGQHPNIEGFGQHPNFGDTQMNTHRIQKRASVVALACVLSWLALIGTAPAQIEAIPGKATPDEIKLLIKQLGADSYDARELATKSLIELEGQALPLVQESLNSSDEEIKARASRIVVEIGRRMDQKRIDELLRKLKINENIDRLIVQLVRDKDTNLQDWQALYQLVKSAIKQLNDEAKRPFAMPFDDVAELNFVDQPNKGVILRKARLAFDKEPPPITTLQDTMLVGNGNIQNLNLITSSIILVNGSINRCLGLRNSVLICREINLLSTATGSLVIVTGKINRALTLTNSYIAAAELESCSMIRSSTFINFSRVPEARLSDSGEILKLNGGAIPTIQKMIALN